MLYADDIGIVSRFTDGLAKMMAVIMVVCQEFGLTVFESKAEPCACGQYQAPQPPQFTLTWQVNDRSRRSTLSTLVMLSARMQSSVEINRHISAAWARLRKYSYPRLAQLPATSETSAA